MKCFCRLFSCILVSRCGASRDGVEAAQRRTYLLDNVVHSRVSFLEVCGQQLQRMVSTLCGVNRMHGFFSYPVLAIDRHAPPCGSLQ